MGLSPKMNVIAWLEFELITMLQFSILVTTLQGTPSPPAASMPKGWYLTFQIHSPFWVHIFFFISVIPIFLFFILCHSIFFFLSLSVIPIFYISLSVIPIFYISLSVIPIFYISLSVIPIFYISLSVIPIFFPLIFAHPTLILFYMFFYLFLLSGFVFRTIFGDITKKLLKHYLII